MKTERIGRGWYRGRTVELIELQYHHGHHAVAWIAPIDGHNDIEPRPTKHEAMAQAIRTIDSM